jgi:hypothetical protein
VGCIMEIEINMTLQEDSIDVIAQNLGPFVCTPYETKVWPYAQQAHFFFYLFRLNSVENPKKRKQN